MCGGGVVVWWIGLGSVVGHWGGLGRALGGAGWCGQGGGDGVVQGIGVGWVGRVGEANPLMVFCIGIDDAKTMLICGQARTGVVSVCERACGVCAETSGVLALQFFAQYKPNKHGFLSMYLRAWRWMEVHPTWQDRMGFRFGEQDRQELVCRAAPDLEVCLGGCNYTFSPCEARCKEV